MAFRTLAHPRPPWVKINLSELFVFRVALSFLEAGTGIDHAAHELSRLDHTSSRLRGRASPVSGLLSGDLVQRDAVESAHSASSRRPGGDRLAHVEPDPLRGREGA